MGKASIIIKVVLSVTLIGIIAYAIYTLFFKPKSSLMDLIDGGPSMTDIAEEIAQDVVDVQLPIGEDAQIAIIEGRYEEAYNLITILLNGVYLDMIILQEAVVKRRGNDVEGVTVAYNGAKSKCSIITPSWCILAEILHATLLNDKKKHEKSKSKLRHMREEHSSYMERMDGRYKEYRDAYVATLGTTEVWSIIDEDVTWEDYPYLNAKVDGYRNQLIGAG
jgi:hypothetical protein